MPLVTCPDCGYICTTDEYRAHELGRQCMPEDYGLDKDDFRMFCRIGQQIKRIADSLETLVTTAQDSASAELEILESESVERIVSER